MSVDEQHWTTVFALAVGWTVIGLMLFVGFAVTLTYLAGQLP